MLNNFVEFTNLSEDLCKLVFNYNQAIISLVKEIPGRSWNPTEKYWTIPSKEIGRLALSFKNASILYSLPEGISLPVEVSDLVHINEDIYSISLDEDIKKFNPKTEPMDHQRIWLQQARNKLRNVPHMNAVLLADEQGLGKTKQVYDYVEFNGYRRVLVISCVASAVWNWESEAKKHTDYSCTILGRTKKGNINTGKRQKLLEAIGDLPKVIITNIEVMRTTCLNPKTRKKEFPIPDLIIDGFRKGELDLIVFDEIHKGMSPQSTQGKLIHKMVKQIREINTGKQCKVILLSGTPIVNAALDAYTTLHIGNLVHLPWYQWAQSVCIFGGFNKHEIIGYKDLTSIKQNLGQIMIRREKNLLNLPPKIRTDVNVLMTPQQDKLYKETHLDLLLKQGTCEVNPATSLLRLRQVIDCPTLVDPEFNMSHCEKLNVLLELCESILQTDGTKIVIFTVWVEVIKMLLPYLRKVKNSAGKPIEDVAVFTGSNKQCGVGDREKEKARFIEDPNCRIMLGTVGALGVSHTLTCAQNVIHYQLPYTYSDFCQDEDRCHRKGTTSTVNSYTLLVKDSVDESVKDIVEGKYKLSEFMLN